MKIGVIGASGKAGSLIAAEAKRRGHEVTAIVRNRHKVAGDEYGIIEKNLFALSATDLKGLEVVISAFGTPFDGSADEEHTAAAEHLVSVFQDLPGVRLLVLGGAASLYTDPGKKRLALEDIPEEFRGVPAATLKGFEKIRESGVNWTYFSPAMNFVPQSRRDGLYIPGTDFVFSNTGGESYLSYADAARALVDEAENGFYVRKRFTAVSERKIPQGGGYYGILDRKPVFEGLSLYRPPSNYELAGKQLRLVMDDGSRRLVNFISGKYLEWSPGGAEGGGVLRLPYDCAKIDELTYFVNFEYPEGKLRMNPVLILDFEQRLVTLWRTWGGGSERYPTLLNGDYTFGAIDMEGHALSEKRHSLTTDLIGRRIHWHYSPETEIIHVYYSPRAMKVTFPERSQKLVVGANATPFVLNDDARDYMNYGYDESAVYIKIKENIYTINSLEKHKAMRGLSGNSMLFLMDTARVHDVGRSFGHREDHVTPENYLFGAYGDFVQSDGKLEAEGTLYPDEEER
jgi:putative NADH-flavin reductase